MEEIKDNALWQAIILGALVGVTAMFLVGTAIVVVGGTSGWVAAGIGTWTGLVIGPYVGGFAVLSRASLKADHAHAAVTVVAEDESLRTAA